jgi:hypothetical protein
MFSSGFAVAKDIKVFGMKTLESVFEYVDSLSDSEPHAETLGRKYNSIWITPPKSNDSFDYYGLVYDNETKTVQGVQVYGLIFEFDYCVGQMEGWIPRLEKRFSTNLERFEPTQGDGLMTVSAGGWVMDNTHYISIRCNQYADGEVGLIFFWRTESLSDAVSDYYDDF